MAQMRERAARHERLAAVTTLAAGAAHELGTPLATIAVASRELERSIRALPEAQGRALIEDASLIRSELERCRAILSRLAADSGHRPGEAPEEVDVAQVVTEIVRGVPPAHRDRLRVEVPKPGRGPSVPLGALVQVAQSLLQNAFEAGGGPVTLSVEATARNSRRVEDEGSGMSPEVLARVGEPFFSTKPPGQGMGLGLFIARTLSEQMGGRLYLESRPGKGTTATVEIGAPGSRGGPPLPAEAPSDAQPPDRGGRRRAALAAGPGLPGARLRGPRSGRRRERPPAGARGSSGAGPRGPAPARRLGSRRGPLRCTSWTRAPPWSCSPATGASPPPSRRFGSGRRTT